MKKKWKIIKVLLIKKINQKVRRLKSPRSTVGAIETRKRLWSTRSESTEATMNAVKALTAIESPNIKAKSHIEKKSLRKNTETKVLFKLKKIKSILKTKIFFKDKDSEKEKAKSESTKDEEPVGPASASGDISLSIEETK